jgi:manganese transport protein
MKTSVSLSEIHRTVSIPDGTRIFKRMFAFFGPAYLVSVGYMDPGNWATDLEGGSKFGYTLIWVLLASNIAAIILQTLAARLGIATGRDLAQSCRDQYPRSVNYILWILAEIAIIACDLAEVLGGAIGINLLFGIPLLWGVLITGLDAMLFLAIQNLGVRKFESFILSLITIIGLCFVCQVYWSQPQWGEVAKGFVPRIPEGALYIVMGIIGATVMPHNLYLHSALVQSRAYDTSPEGKRQACRFNLVDSTIALNIAFFVNAAILIVSAAAFHRTGTEVTELQQAHSLLSPMLGTALAGVLFAVGLICSGQASTITGTLAGQIVMEGYLHFKVRPFLRRLITRLLAIVPAALTVLSTGEAGSYKLLILSQVILSLQLSFAMVPLIHFTNDKRIMGELVNGLGLKILSWIVALAIVGLNIKLVMDQIGGWMQSSPSPAWIWATIVPPIGALGLLLLYIFIKPFIHLPKRDHIPGWRQLSHFIRAEEDRIDLDVPSYKRVGVAVAHTDVDKKVLSHALRLARQHDALLYLFHVVEGASGMVYGSDAFDAETRHDEEYLLQLATVLNHRGVEVEMFLGYGQVAKELVRMVQEQEIDILVMGGHGHRWLSDIILGSTIDPVRHGLTIPVLVVR